MAEIRNLRNPANNPAQNLLTQDALAAGEQLRKGDFTNLQKGIYLDFDNPAQEREQYQKLANVGREGTFALGGGTGGGEGAARSLDTQAKYLADRFSRDASANFQDNVRSAAARVRDALGQSSGYQQNNQQSIISALSNLYGSLPKGNGFLGGLLGMVGGLGSAAITKW